MNIQLQIEHARQKGWLDYYREAASHYGIPVEILLAKDSRESWLGTYPGLQQNGWIGSDGVSKGISQVNKSVWPYAEQTNPNNVRAFVALGAEILKEELNAFNGNMKAALAAYNAGASRVRNAINRGDDPDSVTTNQNYAADIMDRSKEIRRILGGTSLIPLQIQETTKAGFPYVAGGLLVAGVATTLYTTIKNR